MDSWWILDIQWEDCVSCCSIRPLPLAWVQLLLVSSPGRMGEDAHNPLRVRQGFPAYASFLPPCRVRHPAQQAPNVVPTADGGLSACQRHRPNHILAQWPGALCHHPPLPAGADVSLGFRLDTSSTGTEAILLGAEHSLLASVLSSVLFQSGIFLIVPICLGNGCPVCFRFDWCSLFSYFYLF